MKLIADSGSTKCDWLCVPEPCEMQGGGNTADVIRTRGINAVSHAPEAIRTRGINAVLHTPDQIGQVLEELPRELRPREVVFYGAGCGESFPEASETLRGLIARRFATQRVEIHSDLLGAARALLGRGAGIACILGTGSNSCYYDGNRIVQNVPPLGYVLGDEGSGAALGRKLLNGLLKGALGEELLQMFYDEYALSYEAVIRRVYREPQANRFLASLVPFIARNRAMPGVRELVAEAFVEFAERNLERYPRGEVSFTGGVAAAFEPELRAAMLRCGYPVGRVVASPAQGLIEYHERT